jgi:hypothetical protein
MELQVLNKPKAWDIQCGCRQLVGHDSCWLRMAEAVILLDSAKLQHSRFNRAVKRSLRRAAPALDATIGRTKISQEVD